MSLIVRLTFTTSRLNAAEKLFIDQSLSTEVCRTTLSVGFSSNKTNNTICKWVRDILAQSKLGILSVHKFDPS